jgi:hypothetical protein
MIPQGNDFGAHNRGEFPVAMHVGEGPRGLYIGVREIVALEQQRFSAGPGKCVSKAVTKIQSGTVATTTPKVTIRISRDPRV